MLKICWILFFSWLLLDVTVGNESTTKTTTKQIYYKQSISTAAAADAEPQPVSKENVRITMEGQTQSVNTRVLQKKTVPKKGVVPDKSIESPDNYTLIYPSPEERERIINASKAARANKQNFVNLTEILSTEKSNNLHVAPVKEEPQEKLEVVPSGSSTTRKPKPKPTLTYGGNEADDPIPALPTDKSPIIMPRKMDYIVPVIITFTALPLMGVTFYVLYKRGKDYWSKRHYRRMDFLIDGMYNE